MTRDEFEAACEALAEAFHDAGFTDATVNSQWISDGERFAEVAFIQPDEVVKLTELIRKGMAL